ncbi:MAG: exodeoxyribonuclease V subunit gamma [Ramlibacter sp.]
MLHLHFANRYEDLRDLLLARLAGQRDDVFAADQVITPSAAIRRDVALAVADREGVCANVEFMFLARWLWVQVARVVKDVAAESPFDPAALAWRVYGAFGDAEFVAAQPRLAAYLQAAGADDVMRYELAVKTAGLLEQYVTYRTDWLAQWQGQRHIALPAADDAARADERWQAALWQRIAKELDLGAEHPIELLVNELKRGGAERARQAGLPSAVHVFALSAVPPLHIQALQALGRWIDVHLYVVNPCAEYWFEVIAPKRLSHLAARGRDQGQEVGNRLLAAWGRQTQSHIDLLVDAAGEGMEDDARFERNLAGTLLARIQNAILELREVEPGSIALAPADRSIEVHLCHSLTRELEVLHDHLLGLFAAGDGLRPCDVLVVTPDLEAAAPMIEAVFGTSPPERRIPFTITGRSRTTINAPVRELLTLMALVASRCPATAVYALLQQPLIARRYGLDDDALQQVHGWMLDAGIHWGLDSEQVQSLDLPGAGRHSVADGLDRLFLGYALPGGIAEPLGDMLASGDAEGSSAVALGAFWRYVAALQDLRDQFARPKKPTEWAAALHAAIDTFMDPADEDLDDLSELHGAIAELAQAMERGGLDQPVAAGVVRQALESVLDDPARGGVPGGSLTFASMSSLRSLPYPVVCAIGLNDGAFPTTDRPAEFDLMALQPRRGDRQRRADQRNLFLDLLLAARRSLYLSYTGRSVLDNTSLPPSVLVDELLDVLVPAIAEDLNAPESLKKARERLLVAHPLQPFSPAAFNIASDPRLRSFDSELAQALRGSLAAPVPLDSVTIPKPGEEERDIEIDPDDENAVIEPARRFFTVPLAAPGDEWRDVSLEQLIQFFRNPSRYLLGQRMRISLPRTEDELEDDEPFFLNIPSRSALANRLLPILLAEQDHDSESVRRLAAAGTELPDGALGAVVLDRELDAIQRFAAAVRQATAAPLLPPHQATIALDIDGETWRVRAGFADLRSHGLVRWRYDQARATDLLQAWITHLVLCADPPPGAEPTTQWLFLDEPRRFQPRPDAREQLTELVRLYRRGLCYPLPFFPKSAWKYLTGGRSVSKANAQGAWQVIKRNPFAEGADPAYQLAFRGVIDPLADTDFYDLAEKIFGPMLQEKGAAP